MRARAAAIALIVLTGPAFGHERGAQRECRDWLTTCDTTRACQAIGRPASDDPCSPKVLMMREAGPGAQWRASLAFPNETAVPAGARVTLTIDGAPIATVASSAPAPETEAFMPLPAAARGAVLDATCERREFSIAVEPQPSGDAWSPVSLGGARAAMVDRRAAGPRRHGDVADAARRATRRHCARSAGRTRRAERAPRRTVRFPQRRRQRSCASSALFPAMAATSRILSTARRRSSGSTTGA